MTTEYALLSERLEWLRTETERQLIRELLADPLVEHFRQFAPGKSQADPAVDPEWKFALPFRREHSAELAQAVDACRTKFGLAEDPEIFIHASDEISACYVGQGPEAPGPRFRISSGTLKKLRAPGLTAILAHEYGHYLLHEPYAFLKRLESYFASDLPPETRLRLSALSRAKEASADRVSAYVSGSVDEPMKTLFQTSFGVDSVSMVDIRSYLSEARKKFTEARATRIAIESVLSHPITPVRLLILEELGTSASIEEGLRAPEGHISTSKWLDLLREGAPLTQNARGDALRKIFLWTAALVYRSEVRAAAFEEAGPSQEAKFIQALAKVTKASGVDEVASVFQESTTVAPDAALRLIRDTHSAVSHLGVPEDFELSWKRFFSTLNGLLGLSPGQIDLIEYVALETEHSNASSDWVEFIGPILREQAIPTRIREITEIGCALKRGIWRQWIESAPLQARVYRNIVSELTSLYSFGPAEREPAAPLAQLIRETRDQLERFSKASPDPVVRGGVLLVRYMEGDRTGFIVGYREEFAGKSCGGLPLHAVAGKYYLSQGEEVLAIAAFRDAMEFDHWEPPVGSTPEEKVIYDFVTDAGMHSYIATLDLVFRETFASEAGLNEMALARSFAEWGYSDADFEASRSEWAELSPEASLKKIVGSSRDYAGFQETEAATELWRNTIEYFAAEIPLSTQQTILLESCAVELGIENAIIRSLLSATAPAGDAKRPARTLTERGAEIFSGLWDYAIARDPEDTAPYVRLAWELFKIVPRVSFGIVPEAGPLHHLITRAAARYFSGMAQNSDASLRAVTALMYLLSGNSASFRELFLGMLIAKPPSPTWTELPIVAGDYFFSVGERELALQSYLAAKYYGGGWEEELGQDRERRIRLFELLAERVRETRFADLLVPYSMLHDFVWHRITTSMKYDEQRNWVSMDRSSIWWFTINPYVTLERQRDDHLNAVRGRSVPAIFKEQRDEEIDSILKAYGVAKRKRDGAP